MNTVEDVAVYSYVSSLKLDSNDVLACSVGVVGLYAECKMMVSVDL
jgi:hypothetical protein